MTGPVVARVAHARVAGTWVADALVALSETGIALVDAGSATPEPTAPIRIDATLLPPITDAHVHLGLADAAEGRPTTLARVLDLGWDPAALPALVAATTAAHPGLDVGVAGPFLTAPGGYPSDRAWAPPAAVVGVATASDAARAIRARAAAGASVVKLALNSEAGPVPDDALLAAIAAEARAAGLPLVAHAQGAGQAERALAAGVDVLAHTPWTERLSDAVVAAAAKRQTWISTLAMHERDGDAAALARATDNLARFAAAGGAVAYGSDLGNGIGRLDLDPRELAALRRAGVDGGALVDALLAERLLPPGPTVSLLPPGVDGDAAVLAALDRARPTHIRSIAQELA
ncbi:hypothetical protein [Agrococcus carbonis]|uniref:Imidazolonepropionase n=1 Tax=Agrococcus carbonis TaxID=684552 RepID=A0A1H1SFT6_9MICO|nr:hypothetical protein [Agrococcus carbonis]SDS46827.1 Imidazolonepropionase [Agrococcus carbonis]